MHLSSLFSLISIHKFVSVLITQSHKYQVSLVVDVGIPQNSAPFYGIKSILFAYTVSVLFCTEDFGEYVFHLDKHHLILRHHVVCLRLDKCLLIVFMNAVFSLLGSMQFLLKCNVSCLHFIILLLEVL